MTSPSKRRVPLWLSIPVVLLILVAAGWLFGASGQVTGVEFSPDLFEHRSFRYYQWCGIRVTTKHTHVWRSGFDDYLHDSGYVDTTGIKEPRWQLVKGFAPHVRGWSGPAKSLCLSIGCFNGRDERWITWSNDHPELAKVAWPALVQLSREGKYEAVWELLFRLEEPPLPDAEQLQKFIDDARLRDEG